MSVENKTKKPEVSTTSATITILDILSLFGQEAVNKILELDKAGKNMLPKELQESLKGADEIGRKIVDLLLEGDRKGKKIFTNLLEGNNKNTEEFYRPDIDTEYEITNNGMSMGGVDYSFEEIVLILSKEKENTTGTTIQEIKTILKNGIKMFNIENETTKEQLIKLIYDYEYKIYLEKGILIKENKKKIRTELQEKFGASIIVMEQDRIFVYTDSQLYMKKIGVNGERVLTNYLRKKKTEIEIRSSFYIKDFEEIIMKESSNVDK